MKYKEKNINDDANNGTVIKIIIIITIAQRQRIRRPQKTHNKQGHKEVSRQRRWNKPEMPFNCDLPLKSARPRECGRGQGASDIPHARSQTRTCTRTHSPTPSAASVCPSALLRSVATYAVSFGLGVRSV